MSSAPPRPHAAPRRCRLDIAVFGVHACACCACACACVAHAYAVYACAQAHVACMYLYVDTYTFMGVKTIDSRGEADIAMSLNVIERVIAACAKRVQKCHGVSSRVQSVRVCRYTFLGLKR